MQHSWGQASLARLIHCYSENTVVGGSWQCGTLQLDFSMPERFGLDYIGSYGEKHRPAMMQTARNSANILALSTDIHRYFPPAPRWNGTPTLDSLPLAFDTPTPCY